MGHAHAQSRYRINFSDAATTPPTGWLRDQGEPFGLRSNGETYGWVDPVTFTPVDIQNRGRNRVPTPDVDLFRETLMHMQFSDVSAGSQNGTWEMQLANGTYQVLVQLGDPSAESQGSTVHAIRAEGQTLLTFPAPDGQIGVRNGVANVTVSDGRLTLDADGGTNTKIHLVTIEPVSGTRTPAIIGALPADGDVDVVLNPTISANFLNLPNAGTGGATSLDNTTITGSTVQLFAISGPSAGNGASVSATVNGTGGGDAINLTPTANLAANSWYRLVIEGVTDLSGEPILPYSAVFQTGSTVDNGGGDSTGTGGPPVQGPQDLDQVAFTNGGSVASGSRYTTLTMGPDDKLYGLTIGGDIHRWDVNGDGTLANRQVLSGWKSSYGTRTAIGFVFAPNATATNLIAYVSHCSSGLSGAPEWDGRLSRLSGADLQTETLLVTNLPRSIRDHLTNSIVFDPANANVLYFLQGSNSAGGAADGAWGNRPERLLSAACLRLDLTLLPGSLPLDAQTSMTPAVINAADVNSPTLSDGTYNPYYLNAPLTLFATGVRNAYDLVWHSNGQMYIPTNGTAGGSLSPASIDGTLRPDGTVYNSALPGFDVIPAIGPNQTQRDWLFRVDPNTGVGYYGHPNPLRGEFALNRGNADESDYPASMQADPNYRGAAFDFEFNKSPNGVIEYRSNAHGNNLRGALLVCRYSGGSDIIALLPDGTNGDVATSRIGIPGFTGFQDPLDLVEDVSTGNVYVSDYGRSEIVLLRPTAPPSDAPEISLSPDQLVIDQNVGSTSSPFSVVLSNTGNATLLNVQIDISGAASGQFSVSPSPTTLDSLPAGQQTSLNVSFSPTSAGPVVAQLDVSSSTQSIAAASLPLNGLGKSGEPSLQWILDAHLGAGVINVGDDNPATNIIHSASAQQRAPLLGDEISAQLFEQADVTQPVSLEVLGVYGPTSSNPIVAFGWYEEGNAANGQEIFTVTNSPTSNGQTLNVPITGSLNFNATSGSFGFFSRWPFFGNRILYSQDALNAFSGAIPHHVRVYPLPGENNAYVIATEEHISGFDYQDIVVIARNIRPAGSGPVAGGDCDAFDFSEETILPFGGSQDNGTFTVLDAGATLLVEDNAWKHIPISYTITPNTVLTFEFRSTELAEEHAVGFDEVNNFRRFSLYGTQNTSGGAVQDFKNYNGSGQYQSYTIPVGTYFTGAFTQLYFLADNDASPTVGNSFFRNVRLFEDPDGNGICDGDTTPPPPPAPDNTLVLENMTKVPGSDVGYPSDYRYAFSRILNPNRNGNVYADDETETVRIHNPGTTVMQVTGLTISDPTEFSLPNGEGSNLPINIPAGAFYDLEVEFVESSGAKGVREQTLTILSDSGSAVATLAGGYQTAPEGGNEVTARDILQIFGYGTQLPNSFPGEYPTEAEVASGALGDIVVSDYWVQAEDTLPVRAMFLYSQRDIGTSQLAFLDSMDVAVDGLDTRFAQTLNGEVQANTIFPRPAAAPTEGTGFSAASVSKPFKVQVATRNTAGNGAIVAETGKPRYLGVKVYQAKDAQGAVIPNEYIALQDFTPGNHDFNDGLVYLYNIKPYVQDTTPVDTTPAPPAEPMVEYRVNAGGNQVAALDDGPLWEADTRFGPVSYLASSPADHRTQTVSPASIDPAVDAATTPTAIFTRARWDRNGGDDIRYTFPIATPGDYEVRLYLAEPDAGATPGSRVMSVSAEGSIPASWANIDLSVSPGNQIGTVLSEIISVADDSLQLQMIRVIGAPTLAGIEIISNPGPAGGTPGLVLDTDMVAFEAQIGGTTQRADVVLTNDGTATLFDVQIGVSGADASQFGTNISSLDSVQAGQSATITVSAVPSQNGVQRATLTASSLTSPVTAQTVELSALTYATEPSLQAVMDFVYGEGAISAGDDDASTAVIHSDPATQLAALLGDEVEEQAFVASSGQAPELSLVAVYGPAGVTNTVEVGWHEWNMPSSLQPVVAASSSEFGVLEGPASSFAPAAAQFGFYTEWEGLSGRQVFGIDTLNTFTGAIPHQVRVFPLPGESNAYLFAVQAEVSPLTFQDVVFLARNIVPTTIVLPGDTTPPTGDSTIVVHRLDAGGVGRAAIDGGMDWERDLRGSPSPYLLSDPGGSRAFRSTKTGFMPDVPASTNLDIYEYDRWDRGSAGDITYGFPVVPGAYEVRLYFANGDAGNSAPGDRVFSVAVEGIIPGVLTDIDPNTEFGFSTGGVKTHAVNVTDGTLDIELVRGAAGNPFINGIEILELVNARLGANEGVAYVPGPKLYVFPNPVSSTEKLRIELENLAEEGQVSLRLMDQQGRVIRQENLTQGQNREVWVLDNLPAGIYLLQAVGEDWRQSQSIILTE